MNTSRHPQAGEAGTGAHVIGFSAYVTSCEDCLSLWYTSASTDSLWDRSETTSGPHGALQSFLPGDGGEWPGCNTGEGIFPFLPRLALGS